jgi:flagellar basal body-associated protein FliL
MDQQDASGDSALSVAGRLRSGLGKMLKPVALAAAALGVSVAILSAAVVRAYPDVKGGARAVNQPVAGPITFHTIPDFIADLKGARGRSRHVQLAAVVEITEDIAERLRDEEKLIMAEMQTRLRDMSAQELAGAAGVERLRSEMLTIVNRHIAPAQARAVLFTRFLID